MSHIPVIDFKAYSLSYQSAQDGRPKGDEFDRIANELLHAFTSVGFVYLKNTGISSEQVENVLRVGDAFFEQPKEVKAKYTFDEKTLQGWVPMGQEKHNPARPGDLKESFNILPTRVIPWPTEEVPHFKDIMLAFYNSCTELAKRVLDVLSYGLKLKDDKHLIAFHDIASGRAPTYLRYNYYPSLDGTEIKPGYIRIGEHTDYGSITLLFQDQVGGLEVQCRDGVYRPATPIPDTVLVNIGDLLQRWSSDILVSNSHRVVLPPEHELKKARRSLAFFLNPNDDCLIECLDGSNKYPPVVAADYFGTRVSTLFKGQSEAY